jgi:hypothetical protein
MKLPNEIFVIKEKDGNDSYLIAFNSLDEIPMDQNGDSVGVYQLQETRKLKVTTELI